jgi:hypothetical protein
MLQRAGAKFQSLSATFHSHLLPNRFVSHRGNAGALQRKRGDIPMDAAPA